jgi:hypothetical protein
MVIERVLVEISVPPPTSFPCESSAEVVARRNRSSCTSSRFCDTTPAYRRADPTSVAQRLVSYLVKTTKSGNVRVSTRFRFS